MNQQSIFSLVHADLEERDRLGWRQHSRPLLANDGRDSLREAYEEALDLAVYLRKALAERETGGKCEAISGGSKEAIVTAGEIGRQMQACDDKDPISPEGTVFTLDRVYSPEELSAEIAKMVGEDEEESELLLDKSRVSPGRRKRALRP